MGKFSQQIYLKTYRFYYGKGKEIPAFISKHIAKVNFRQLKKQFGDGLVDIDTYDHSHQLTHPDIIMWKGEKYLVATPYPYNIDIYENPCVFRYGEGGYKQICGPLVKPANNKEYYSDPVMVPAQDALYLYFRKTERKTGSDSILMSKTTDGLTWTDPLTVYKNDSTMILSPAIIVRGGEWRMFFVDYREEKRSTVKCLYSRDGIVWQEDKNVNIQGVPEDGFIWHLSLNHSDLTDEFDGIVLIKSKEKYYKGLYKIKFVDNENWKIIDRIQLPSNVEGKIRNPYKCAYDEQNSSILIPLRDNYDRWLLYKLQI